MNSYSGNYASKMTQGIFTSASKGYYIGASTILNTLTPTITFSQQVAFVMSMDDKDSCITFTDSTSTVTQTAVTIGSSYALKLSINTMGNPTYVHIAQSPIIYSLGASSTYPSYFCNMISPSAMSDQTYYVGTGSQSFTFSAFTIDSTCSGSHTFIYTAELDAGGTWPSFLSLNSTLKKFSLNTNSATAGSYLIDVFGTINGTTLANFASFNLNIINCSFTAIPTVQTFVYTVGAPHSHFYLSAFTLSDTSCTASYSVEMINGSGIDGSIFTFIDTTLIMDVETTDTTTINTYQFYLIGTPLGGTTPTMNLFEIQIEDPCTSTSITTPVISDEFYDISELYIASGGPYRMQISDSSCHNSLDYTLAMNDSSALPAFFTTQLASNGFSWSVITTSLQDVGTYELQMKGTIDSFPTNAYVVFPLTISNDCRLVDPGNYTYQIGDPALSITIAQFSSTSYNCASYQFSASQISPTAGSIPTCMSFDSTNNILNVITSSITQAGTYIILVTETLSTISQNISFQVEVMPPCNYISTRTSSVASQVYYLYASAKTFTIYPFISNVSTTICGDYSYTIQQSSDDGSTYVTLDSTLFTFNTSPSISLSIYGSIYYQAGTYFIQITGTQGTYTASSATISFTVIIIDPCLSTTISIPPSFGTLTYYIGQPAQTIIFEVFTDSVGTCGSFTYYISYSIGMNNVLTFDSSTRSIKIYTDDFSMAGSYAFAVFGFLSYPYKYGSFLSNLNVICLSEIIPTSISTQYYQVKDPASSISLGDYFSTSPNCGFNFTYTAKLSSGSDLPSFIAFSQTTNKFSISTTNNSLAGSYIINVVATLNDSLSTSDDSFYIFLTVIRFNSPPYFLTNFADQKVIAGQTVKYTIPTSADSEGDTVLESINLGGAAYFVTYSDQIITISPPSTAKNGSYSIYINLDDQNGGTNSGSFTIQTIELTSTDISSGSSSTSDDGSSDSITNTIGDDSTSNGFSSSVYSKGGSYQSGSYNMTFKNRTNASIPIVSINEPALIIAFDEISMKGVAKLSFSQSLIIPNDYSIYIDSTQLDVELIKGDPYVNISLLSWNVTSFTSSELLMQLQFTNPLLISTETIKDRLNITFLDNYYFVGKSNNQTINPGYNISLQIPQQFEETSATKAVEAIVSSMKNTVGAAIVINVLVTLLIKISLKRLWCMINMMQMVVLMPMLAIETPQNVAYYLSIFLTIMNFKIIPTDYIIGLITKAKAEAEITNAKFVNSGYGSPDLMKNLGMFIIALIGLVLVIGIIFLLKYLSNKKPLIMKLYQKLYTMFIFNGIIRTILTGYLFYLIACLIQLQSAQYDTISHTVSSTIAFLMVVSLTVFPAATYMFILKNMSNLNKTHFELKFISLYQGIDTLSSTALLFNSLQLGRRLLFAIQVVLLADFIICQLYVLMLISLSILIFYFYVNPIESKEIKFLQAFNDICLLVCFDFAFIFTEFVPDATIRYTAGWCFLGIVVLNIAVNLIMLMVPIVIIIKDKLKSKCRKQIKKQNKYLDEDKSFSDIQQTAQPGLKDTTIDMFQLTSQALNGDESMNDNSKQVIKKLSKQSRINGRKLKKKQLADTSISQSERPEGLMNQQSQVQRKKKQRLSRKNNNTTRKDFNPDQLNDNYSDGLNLYRAQANNMMPQQDREPTLHEIRIREKMDCNLIKE